MENMCNRFRFQDEFFGRYQRLVKDTVIPFQEAVLKDQMPEAEKSHAIENFRLAAEYQKTGVRKGEFYGMVFQDSDVAKWLEGVAYSLILFPDLEQEARCDEIIDLIADAQYPDGYLNTYFTLKEPDRKWTDLAEAHELYCAGHMMEAAVAYYHATGKRKLLDVMCRMADHIYRLFIEDKKEGYPGHPEVELALMRLWETTGEERYRILAEHFINVRGVDSDYFHREAATRGWYVWAPAQAPKEYAQNHAPVRDQDAAVGHAVRSVYLLTGMAKVAAATEDESLKEACRRLWSNITDKRMYVTGGIGSAYEGEAFTKDYHLPNDTAYAETCASIGLVFFARAMFGMEKKRTYIDTLERALYNTVLAGMQLDGKRFFYVNPLEILPGISGEAATHHHTLPQRPGWFTCACCPPNVARLLPSLAEYAWMEEGDTLYSNLFVGGTLNLEDKGVEVQTNYPYEGTVTYLLHGESQSRLAVRLPGWSRNTQILVNGAVASYVEQDGYAYLEDVFHEGTVVELRLDMEVRKVYANPKVSADSGKVSFMRGPLVYCAEGVDQKVPVLSLSGDRNVLPVAGSYETDLLDGVVTLQWKGYGMAEQESLYAYQRPEMSDQTITLIPYYAWGNRGLNEMRVWIPEN